MSARRRWIAALAVVVLGGVGVLVATRTGASRCSDAAVPADQVPAVFAAVGAPVVRADPRLQGLIAAVQGSGLGRVLGAVAYDQTHYLRTAALPDGFATWTADNAVVGFRSRSGLARWGLRQSTDPQAWALVGTTFVSLDLRPRASLRLVAYRSVSGAVAWCADTEGPTRPGDPLTVAAGVAGSTWVVSAGPTVTHLDASGRAVAHRVVRDVDRGAFVKQVGSLLLVGGRAGQLLTAPDPRVPVPRGPSVTALDAATLRPRWVWGRGVAAHAIGETEGLLVLEVAQHAGLSLVALDLRGRTRWTTALPAGTTADMTLIPAWRTVVVRSDRSLAGYDTGNGSRRWTRSLGPAAFPDGFDLGAQPRVGDALLLGTSSALVVLSREGRARPYPLPEAGTDFWPYEIAVSGREAVIETNAGAVLVALRPQA